MASYKVPEFVYIAILAGSDATTLGTYAHSGVLTAGALYTRTEDVTIPNAIYGNFTIFVLTDSSNHVFEYTDEDDNTQQVRQCT